MANSSSNVNIVVFYPVILSQFLARYFTWIHQVLRRLSHSVNCMMPNDAYQAELAAILNGDPFSSNEKSETEIDDKSNVFIARDLLLNNVNPLFDFPYNPAGQLRARIGCNTNVRF